MTEIKRTLYYNMYDPSDTNQNKSAQILDKAMQDAFLDREEALFLWQHASLGQLMHTAQQIRMKKHPKSEVSWIIDRNVNYTNICNSACKFCNFWRAKNHKEACITPLEAFIPRIEEMWKLGGRQLLLQGGLHPELGQEYYELLFKRLKSYYPELKLHALGPPEIVHIAKIEGISFRSCLLKLREAGLDSLPGAGAEILSDRVRKILSPNKCTTAEWFDVMREAHKIGMTTSATMMFGHIETIEERIDHLIAVRDVQADKPKESKGFISFIPWPFQGKGTVLSKLHPEIKAVSANEYIRLIALSRIMLPNISNIQASWLTVGKNTGQICLHAGANDFGSIMIEENVVSVAGANFRFDKEGIQFAIREAGFVPVQRDQEFNILKNPTDEK